MSAFRVEVVLSPSGNDTVSLDLIRVDPAHQRRGLADSVVILLARLSDELGVSLETIPRALPSATGEGGMTDFALRRFYRRHGFHALPGRPAESVMMRRDPWLGRVEPPLATIMERSTISQRPRVAILNANSAARVAEAVRASGLPCAWVDGFARVGKSAFAAELAHLLGWRHVNFDGWVSDAELDSESYADFIDDTKVRPLIGTRELRAGTVLDGVCLREVLRRFDALDADAFVVYVAKVTDAGDSLVWHDGSHVEDGPTRDTPWLVRALIRYHAEVHPYADARQILLRVEAV